MSDFSRRQIELRMQGGAPKTHMLRKMVHVIKLAQQMSEGKGG